MYDIDRRPRGIVLVRLENAGASFRAPTNPADFVPLLDTGSADARHWKADATTGQQWNFDTNVATAPLANGTTAANHKRREPVRLSFDAIVTDTPLVPFGPLGGLPGVRRADALLASLYALRDTQDFIAVVSPVRTIPVAILKSIALNRTDQDGSAYFVTLGVEEVLTFELQLISSIDDAAAQLGAKITTAGGVIIGG